MSKETVAFLLSLLDQVTLQASAPDFEQTAVAIVLARKELQAQVKA